MLFAPLPPLSFAGRKRRFICHPLTTNSSYLRRMGIYGHLNNILRMSVLITLPSKIGPSQLRDQHLKLKSTPKGSSQRKHYSLLCLDGFALNTIAYSLSYLAGSYYWAENHLSPSRISNSPARNTRDLFSPQEFFHEHFLRYDHTVCITHILLPRG
jgi:hypothetical protein